MKIFDFSSQDATNIETTNDDRGEEAILGGNIYENWIFRHQAE